MHRSAGYRFAIDRGGTFTDVYARLPDGSERVLKLLSEDPANYADAPFEGIRRIMAAAGEDTRHLNGECIDSIRMGTTVATNALLERRGTPTLLVTSTGLGDLLQIGDQSRDQLFSLKPQNRTPCMPKCWRWRSESVPHNPVRPPLTVALMAPVLCASAIRNQGLSSTNFSLRAPRDIRASQWCLPTPICAPHMNRSWERSRPRQDSNRYPCRTR